MRTYEDPAYLLPGPRPIKRNDQDSHRQLETLVRPRLDAAKWTWIHCGCLVVASLMGVLLFSFVTDPLARGVLICAATVIFASGINTPQLLLPLVVPLAAGILTTDVNVAIFLAPAACLFSFCDQFTRAHLFLQSAQPVSLSNAAKLRKTNRLWRYYLAALLFVLISIGICSEPQDTRAESFQTFAIALHYFLPRLALVYLLFPPYDKFGAFTNALRSWFAYDFNGIAETSRHMCRHPAGPMAKRFIAPYSLAFLMSGLVPSPFIHLPTGIEAIPAVKTALFQASFADNVLFCVQSVLSLWSAIFILTAPLLVRACRVADQARGNDFQSYMERLEPTETYR